MIKKKSEAMIGAILLRMGKINKRQLAIALVSCGTHSLLGETLIEMNWITEDDLERAIEIQKRMKNGKSASIAALEIVEERIESGKWNDQLFFLRKG